MSREFNFEKFKSGVSLLEQLTAERLNAMLDAISRNRPVPGLNMTQQATPGGIILRSQASGDGGTTIGKTPFLVYASVDNQDPPFPILKVYPGKMAGLIPTLAGAKLDVPDTSLGLHPWLYPPGAPFSLFLRCKINVDVTNLFRASVTEVLVVTDNDALAVPDIGDDGEIPEFKVKWDDGDTHNVGHFYILIADVDMATVEAVIIFKGSVQWLYNSYSSFVASGTEAIPVV